MVQGSLETFRENCFLLQLWQVKDMRKYSSMSDGLEFSLQEHCDFCVKFPYMATAFGNYETVYLRFWTVQFLIGFRSVEEHFSFPYLCGLRETSKQEWTNHIVSWLMTLVGANGKVLGQSEDFTAGCCRKGCAGHSWPQTALQQAHCKPRLGPSSKLLAQIDPQRGWGPWMSTPEYRIPWRECRLYRTHTGAWKKSGMQAAAERNAPIVHTAHCLAEGTECHLWWDQGVEDRCLWQKKSDAETMNGEERYLEISWA